jgi:hypothetical protein
MPREIAYVVLGAGHGSSAGRIKPVPLADNIKSPLIDLANGIARISTREEVKRTGTRFLRDLYLEEDRENHWLAFKAHRDAIFAGRTVTPFPDELLPAAVNKLVADAKVGSPSGKFDAAEFLQSLEKPATLPAFAPAKPTRPAP